MSATPGGGELHAADPSRTGRFDHQFCNRHQLQPETPINTPRKVNRSSRSGLTRRNLLAGLITVSACNGLPLRRSAAAPIAEAVAAKLIAAATSQIGVTTVYDPSYQRLKFPGGDVPPDRGVCTDVIVRAYRAAFGFDLQEKLNADMRAHGALYPKRWGAVAPDANIDHRRVPNLQTYFTRQGAARPREAAGYAFQPGDLVTQMVPVGRPHIAIVSATPSPQSGRLMLIHNIGRGTQLEDTLDTFPITGRYRFFPTA